MNNLVVGCAQPMHNVNEHVELPQQPLVDASHLNLSLLLPISSNDELLSNNALLDLFSFIIEPVNNWLFVPFSTTINSNNH